MTQKRMRIEGHELDRVATTLGANRRRTMMYAYCECGFGINASVNMASIHRKHQAHLKDVAVEAVA